MNPPIVVIPIEGNPNILAARPILGDFVMLFENTNQMHRMLFSNVFHSKIIDDKCERDRTSLVSPQARDRFALRVSMFVQPLF